MKLLQAWRDLISELFFCGDTVDGRNPAHSCTTWDVKNPVNNRIFMDICHIRSTDAGFLPSTVG